MIRAILNTNQFDTKLNIIMILSQKSFNTSLIGQLIATRSDSSSGSKITPWNFTKSNSFLGNSYGSHLSCIFKLDFPFFLKPLYLIKLCNLTITYFQNKLFNITHVIRLIITLNSSSHTTLLTPSLKLFIINRTHQFIQPAQHTNMNAQS